MTTDAQCGLLEQKTKGQVSLKTLQDNCLTLCLVRLRTMKIRRASRFLPVSLLCDNTVQLQQNKRGAGSLQEGRHPSILFSINAYPAQSVGGGWEPILAVTERRWRTPRISPHFTTGHLGNKWVNRKGQSDQQHKTTSPYNL